MPSTLIENAEGKEEDEHKLAVINKCLSDLVGLYKAATAIELALCLLLAFLFNSIYYVYFYSSHATTTSGLSHFEINSKLTGCLLNSKNNIYTDLIIDLDDDKNDAASSFATSDDDERLRVLDQFLNASFIRQIVIVFFLTRLLLLQK
jgi:hypothetical protein